MKPSREEVRKAIQTHMSAQLNYRPDLDAATDAVLALWSGKTKEKVRNEAFEEAAKVAERLDFGPSSPFTYSSAHKWGAIAAATAIRRLIS